MDSRMAIIDLGSNSIRMIIMEVSPDGGYKMVKQLKEMVRLAEGMGPEMLLKPTAIKRTIEALYEYKKIIEFHQIEKVYAYATAAVRNAKNRDNLLQQSPIVFEVLTGTKESYYDFLGVVNTIQTDNGIIIDTGGGSTELILVKDRQMAECISIPLGAVNMTETYPMEALEGIVSEQLKKIYWLKEMRKMPIIGLGGTIRILSKLSIGKERWHDCPLHQFTVTLTDIKKMLFALAAMPIAKRKRIKGMDKERADIIVAGLMPLYCLMQLTESPLLTIGGYGLREGAFFEQYFKGKSSPILEDVLGHSIENTMKKFAVNVTHANNVKMLTDALIEGFKPVFTLDKSEKKVLSSAALLHDTVEDVEGIDYKTILEEFGKTIADLVKELTSSDEILNVMGKKD